jgi:hypothetical protein
VKRGGAAGREPRTREPAVLRGWIGLDAIRKAVMKRVLFTLKNPTRDTLFRLCLAAGDGFLPPFPKHQNSNWLACGGRAQAVVGWLIDKQQSDQEEGQQQQRREQRFKQRRREASWTYYFSKGR